MVLQQHVNYGRLYFHTTRMKKTHFSIVLSRYYLDTISIHGSLKASTAVIIQIRMIQYIVLQSTTLSSHDAKEKKESQGKRK